MSDLIPYLCASDAAKLVKLAGNESVELNQSIAVAVVDAGGHLLAFQRDDNTMLGAVDAALLKAKTANNFCRSTEEMQKKLESGKTAYLSLPNCLPLEGGAPLFIGSNLVGAIGISGAPSTMDTAIVNAVVKWWREQLQVEQANV